MSFRKASIDMDKGEPFGCFELNFFVFNLRFSFFLFQMLNQKCVFEALHLVSKKIIMWSVVYCLCCITWSCESKWFIFTLDWKVEKCQCSKCDITFHLFLFFCWCCLQFRIFLTAPLVWNISVDWNKFSSQAMHCWSIDRIVSVLYFYMKLSHLFILHA